MRVHRSLAFRLIALYVALFATSIATLLVLAEILAERAIRSQILEGTQREATTLADELRATDPATAAVLVARRLQRGRSSYYLLQDATGSVIAGNVAPVIPHIGAFESRIELPAVPHDGIPATLPELRGVIGFGLLLSDDTFVMAADDSDRIDKTRRAMLSAFVGTGALSIIFAIAGGLLLSRGVVRRIAIMNETAGTVMAGRLEARIPARPDGDEIDTLAIKLNAMLDRIQSLMENLKQVSSDIAHDLRTPLSRLRQQLESARDIAGTPDQFRAAADKAIGETDDLLQTFSALLRIAQIETHSRRAGFAKVDLSSMVDLVVDTFRPLFEDEGREFRANILPEITVLGDKELLMQLMTNLIENAIRHTPRSSSLDLELAKNSQDAVLTIADSGPGIPPEEREKVLQRFYRLERSRTVPGSGLGLPLVVAIVEIHAGKIRLLDNAPGLRVEVQIPLYPAHEKQSCEARLFTKS